MSSSLLSLPDSMLREIFEYAIDTYTTENRERYTLICKQLYLLFKIIIKDQVDKFKRNPILLRLVEAKLLSSIVDNYSLAVYIKFNYDLSDRKVSLQAIEFLKRCLFRESGGLKFGYHSYGHALLRRIVKSGPEKFRNVTGLEYEQIIGPIVIEFFAQRGDDFAERLAGMFFKKSTWIYQFMMGDVIDWMQTKNIPESPLERERLIKAIYKARLHVILSVYNGAAHIIITALLICSSINSDNPIFNSYDPLILSSFFLLMFVLTAYMQNTTACVNIHPLNESELEVKAKEIDYFNDT